MARNIHKVLERSVENAAKRKLVSDFKSVDRRELIAKSDMELAEWQAQHPTDSPQHIIANYEWIRRATVDQTKAMQRAAYIGVGAAIAGGVVGALLTAYLSQ